MDDGGYAFPNLEKELQPNIVKSYSKGGMSLRDKFADSAMKGFLSNSKVLESSEDIARQSYRQADAMLIERQKGK